jgi:hypothetical protein
MQFNTKLNIGDSVWTVSPTDALVKQVTVERIQIFYTKKDNTNAFSYGTDDGFTIYEAHEGQRWWRTRDALVKHLLGGPEQPCHGECQCTGGGCKDADLEALLNEMIKSEESTRKSSKDEMVDAFEAFFKAPPKKEHHCGCGCQHQDLEGVLSDMPKFQSGKPKHVTEEEAFVKELERQAKSKNQSLSQLFDDLFSKPQFAGRLTPKEQQEIDDEFDALFGEHVCTRPKAKTQNELNQLYEELFDR